MIPRPVIVAEIPALRVEQPASLREQHAIVHILRRRGLTDRLSFNLPLTQEQIADHLGLTLVHVNRTLRRLREERLVLVERQVVTILDLEGLRELARGVPHAAEALDPVIPLDRLP